MQVLLLEEVGVLEAVGGLQGHVAATGSRERREAEMMAAGACVYSGKGTREADVRKAAELLYKVCEDISDCPKSTQAIRRSWLQARADPRCRSKPTLSTMPMTI